MFKNYFSEDEQTIRRRNRLICDVIVFILIVFVVFVLIKPNITNQEKRSVNIHNTPYYQAWINLGGQWTLIDVGSYRFYSDAYCTVIAKDGTVYKTSYENVVIIEGGE